MQIFNQSLRVRADKNNSEMIFVHKIDVSPSLWFLQKRGNVSPVKK